LIDWWIDWLIDWLGSQGFNVSSSPLYAIFCTQSNDFALGFPVLSALYNKSHPEYPMYLYLLGKCLVIFISKGTVRVISIGTLFEYTICNQTLQTLVRTLIWILPAHDLFFRFRLSNLFISMNLTVSQLLFSWISFIENDVTSSTFLVVSFFSCGGWRVPFYLHFY